MRSVWKGNISYRASAIPVRVYAATEDRGTNLHQLHRTDGGRIRLKRVCEVDNEEVSIEEVVRGHELPGGDVVALTDEDLAALPAAPQSIRVVAFAANDEIDPIYFGKSYYLEPEPAGAKPYALLTEALQRSRHLAIVRIALRQRESLGVLRVRDQMLVLATMLWPDEVRTPDFPFLHEDIELRPDEIQPVVDSIERLSQAFVPADYTDDYLDALNELITAKAEGRQVLRPVAAREEAGTQDLMSALLDGVAEAEQEVPAQRGAAAGRAKAAERKAASAKETAKKAAAKLREKAKPRR